VNAVVAIGLTVRHPLGVTEIPVHDFDVDLAEVRASPTRSGTVELIARRPAEDEREILEQAQLDPAVGLVGDRWHTYAAKHGSDNQLTLMNSRAAALVAGPRSRWAIAGDQLYVDFDLSAASIPPGTRLSLGSAVIEVTAIPHTGCGKFSRRFGVEAQKLVNSAAGRKLNLRGINAKVVRAGTVRTRDRILKLQ
jgi:MOSC domain-containing protein YiiM